MSASLIPLISSRHRQLGAKHRRLIPAILPWRSGSLLRPPSWSPVASCLSFHGWRTLQKLINFYLERSFLFARHVMVWPLMGRKGKLNGDRLSKQLLDHLHFYQCLGTRIQALKSLLASAWSSTTVPGSLCFVAKRKRWVNSGCLSYFASSGDRTQLRVIKVTDFQLHLPTKSQIKPSLSPSISSFHHCCQVFKSHEGRKTMNKTC